MKLNELLIELEKILSPYPVYAVGGCVRDYIMELEPKDYDFTTSANPDEIERLVKASGKRAYLVGKRFGTIGCKINNTMVEITTFRKEAYEQKNRKPNVEFVDNITDDLSRRDFTINAIALRLVKGKERIIDPFNGVEDIENKIIRCVGSPKTRFKEDPLRILRAVRFACRFNFMIEDDTQNKMQKMGISLLDISKERWCMELDKILQSERVIYGLILLWDNGLFKFMIPELQLQLNYNQNSKYHSYCLDVHTYRVVSSCPKEDLDLRWAGLLHDIAKPFVRTDKENGESNYVGHEVLGAEMANRIALHLKWSNERRERVVELIKNHLNEDCELRKYDNISKIKLIEVIENETRRR